MMLHAITLASVIALGQPQGADRPVDAALALCVNVVTQSREAVHPRTLGFEMKPGVDARRTLSSGGWIDLGFKRDPDGTRHCTLNFDGDQTDVETRGAVEAAVGRLRLSQVRRETRERYHSRKVDDVVATTYEGSANGHRVVLVYRWASKVPGKEDLGRDSIHVFSPAIPGDATPPQGGSAARRG